MVVCIGIGQQCQRGNVILEPVYGRQQSFVTETDGRAIAHTSSAVSSSGYPSFKASTTADTHASPLMVAVPRPTAGITPSCPFTLNESISITYCLIFVRQWLGIQWFKFYNCSRYKNHKCDVRSGSPCGFNKGLREELREVHCEVHSTRFYIGVYTKESFVFLFLRFPQLQDLRPPRSVCGAVQHNTWHGLWVRVHN